jgi:hypothetical protein
MSFLQPWREMAVVALNHANRSAHLYGEGMYIHTVVQQCECRVGVAEAVKRSVQASTWAFDQTRFLS